jgi:dCMP deaminase
VCELLRQKSNDPFFTVGCCLVRSDTRQLQSIGYNGFLVGENNDPDVWKRRAKKAGKTAADVREDYLQHAETNAIHFSSQTDLVDTIAYVSCLPCQNCCAKLIQKRVPAVVYNISQEKYLQPSLEAFKLAGIHVLSFNDIEPHEGSKVCVQLEGFDNPSKDWEVLFMAIAVLASRRCEKEVVSREGCVIVKEKQILGYGYSGYPQLMMKKPYKIDGFPTISAIQNALCFTANVRGATVYCTNFPDHESIKELIQRGVAVVKYLHAPEEKICKPLDPSVPLSEAEGKAQEDYQKVIKLAMKNSISLRIFGKGESEVDIDVDVLNVTTEVLNVPKFDEMKVTVITVEEAKDYYSAYSHDKSEEVKITVPDQQDLSIAKEDMKDWLISPESIRTIKLKREQAVEIKRVIDFNTPKKKK